MSIVRSNVNFVRDQIEAKVGSKPFYASQNAVNLNVTDIDTFPYPRFYRGVYQLSEPVVMEREAGWRQRHDMCYEPTRVYEVEQPKYCWQVEGSNLLITFKLTKVVSINSILFIKILCSLK